ncbi:hypothetical protein LF41_2158 [Lysobacter dokdonensis DS-58]|uniref:Uncharacterized protein n=1 Tax=Lysobacter dokdonensis DS-58 TaxID=1300345 RepID=A0A0A2X4R6_9GAMM|nr:hypothetical protein [Lysobacter dokdonensis]KGQ20204.1 hypothetical protein LF41_2158 [Lysobacter dokdonensis DS-58]
MKSRDAAATPVPVPATHAAQQVAYAWQVAARDLRFTHPELHAQMTERVRKLLDVEVLDDPALEIRRLQAELDAVRTMLVSAAPMPTHPPPPATNDATPTRAALQAVADGARAFTDDEREWCVGEAMVLTGFSKTPVELLREGEAALARIVLVGSP